MWLRPVDLWSKIHGWDALGEREGVKYMYFTLHVKYMDGTPRAQRGGGRKNRRGEGRRGVGLLLESIGTYGTLSYLVRTLYIG